MVTLKVKFISYLSKELLRNDSMNSLIIKHPLCTFLNSKDFSVDNSTLNLLILFY